MSQEMNIGRVVHFLTNRPDGSRDVAPGIVTFVNSDGSIDLTVFRRNSAASPLSRIFEDATPEAAKSAYSWTWPSRV